MNRRHRHALFTSFALSLVAVTAHDADAVVAPPDGRTMLRIAKDGTTFSVVRKGETVIAASPLPGARRPARRTRTFTIPPHGTRLVRCT